MNETRKPAATPPAHAAGSACSHAWQYRRKKSARTAFRTCALCGRQDVSKRAMTGWTDWVVQWECVPGFKSPNTNQSGGDQ